MRYVTLQPREIVFRCLPPVPLPDDDEIALFTSTLTLRDAQTIDLMAAQLLSRIGLHRVRVGGRYYLAAEKRVVADIRAFELDLGEIAAQIEEALQNCYLDS